MIVGEILSEHGCSIASIGHRYVGRGWLCREKRFQVTPLVGDAAVQRIVDQHSEIQLFGFGPTRRLRALLVQIKLHIILCYSRWDSVLLPNGGNGDGDVSRACCDGAGCKKPKRNCKRSEQRDNVICNSLASHSVAPFTYSHLIRCRFEPKAYVG